MASFFNPPNNLQGCLNLRYGWSALRRHHGRRQVDVRALSHGGHPALKAPRFAVLVWHTGGVTKHPIALFVLSTVAEPEGFLGQQQIVVKNNAFAALARLQEQAFDVI